MDLSGKKGWRYLFTEQWKGNLNIKNVLPKRVILQYCGVIIIVAGVFIFIFVRYVPHLCYEDLDHLVYRNSRPYAGEKEILRYRVKISQFGFLFFLFFIFLPVGVVSSSLVSRTWLFLPSPNLIRALADATETQAAVLTTSTCVFVFMCDMEGVSLYWKAVYNYLRTIGAWSRKSKLENDPCSYFNGIESY